MFQEQPAGVRIAPRSGMWRVVCLLGHPCSHLQSDSKASQSAAKSMLVLYMEMKFQINSRIKKVFS